MLSCDWSPGSALPNVKLRLFFHGSKAWVSWQTIRIIDTVRAAILKWFVVPIFRFICCFRFVETGLLNCINCNPVPHGTKESSSRGALNSRLVSADSGDPVGSG